MYTKLEIYDDGDIMVVNALLNSATIMDDIKEQMHFVNTCAIPTFNSTILGHNVVMVFGYGGWGQTWLIVYVENKELA